MRATGKRGACRRQYIRSLLFPAVQECNSITRDENARLISEYLPSLHDLVTRLFDDPNHNNPASQAISSSRGTFVLCVYFVKNFASIAWLKVEMPDTYCRRF